MKTVEEMALEVLVAQNHWTQGEYAWLMEFFMQSLAAVDAERGKDAAFWQFQSNDGKWYQFIDERHRLNTIAAGYPVRPLFLSTTIPEGMALVPIEPTEAMITAFGDYESNSHPMELFGTTVAGGYKAMLKAAGVTK